MNLQSQKVNKHWFNLCLEQVVNIYTTSHSCFFTVCDLIRHIGTFILLMFSAFLSFYEIYFFFNAATFPWYLKPHEEQLSTVQHRTILSQVYLDFSFTDEMVVVIY